MQRRHLSMLAALAIAATTAVAAWWLLRDNDGKGNVVPGNLPAQIEDRPFERDDFFPTFDLNQDKSVTFEEFERVYATWGEDKRFSRGPGQPGLDARAAFDFFDLNRDGGINADDIRFAWDDKWHKFAQLTRDRGLTPRIFKGRWLALNQHQVDALAKEEGAIARGELPFAGAFFDRKLLLSGRYGLVTRPDGTSNEGFLSERDGRIWVVAGDARLLVFKPDAVTVKELPASPALEYIKAVSTTPFDEPAANLKLALRCIELGLKTEAGALFARVLIFEPGNSMALEALNLRLENDRFVPRNG